MRQASLLGYVARNRVRTLGVPAHLFPGLEQSASGLAWAPLTAAQAARFEAQLAEWAEDGDGEGEPPAGEFVAETGLLVPPDDATPSLAIDFFGDRPRKRMKTSVLCAIGDPSCAHNRPARLRGVSTNSHGGPPSRASRAKQVHIESYMAGGGLVRFLDDDEQATFNANINRWRSRDIAIEEACDAVLAEMPEDERWEIIYDLVDEGLIPDCRSGDFRVPPQTFEEVMTRRQQRLTEGLVLWEAANRRECAVRRVQSFDFAVVAPTDATQPRGRVEDMDSVLELIFSFLDPTAIGRAATVSRRWRHAAHADGPWKHICTRSFPLLVTLKGLSNRSWRELYVQRALATAPPALRPKPLQRDGYMIGVEIRHKGETGNAHLFSVVKALPCGAARSSFLLSAEIAKETAMTDDEYEELLMDQYCATALFDVSAFLVRIADQSVLSLGSHSTHREAILEELLVDMVEDDPWGCLVWSVPGMTMTGDDDDRGFRRGTYIRAKLSACLKKGPRVEGKSFGASSVSGKTEAVLTHVELHLKAVEWEDEIEPELSGDVEEMLTTAEGLAFRSRWA